MRFINYNWYVTLFVSFLIFLVSRKICFKYFTYKYLLIFWTTVMFSFSLVFPLAYFGDYLGEMPIYSMFRSINYSEIMIVFAIPLISFFTVYIEKRFNITIINKIMLNIIMFIICIGYVTIPYVKPIIRPFANVTFQNKWKDNISIQTTSSTCGPACLATILNYYGKTDTEFNIAKKSFSSGSGTENWYLARYAKKQGLNYFFGNISNISNIKTPAIIGVNLGNYGHFITVLKQEDKLFYVGDPMSGLHILTEEEFGVFQKSTIFLTNVYLSITF